MKTLQKIALSSLLTGILFLSGCSNDDVLSSDKILNTNSLEDKSALDFVAQLTPEQEENFNNCGEVFLPEQQKMRGMRLLIRTFLPHGEYSIHPLNKLKMLKPVPSVYGDHIRHNTGL